MRLWAGDSSMMSELQALLSIFASVSMYDLTMEFGCCYSDNYSFNDRPLHLISDGGGSMSLQKNSKVLSGSRGGPGPNS